MLLPSVLSEAAKSFALTPPYLPKDIRPICITAVADSRQSAPFVAIKKKTRPHIVFGWMLTTKQQQQKKKKCLAEQVLLSVQQISNLCSLQLKQVRHFHTQHSKCAESISWPDSCWQCCSSTNWRQSNYLYTSIKRHGPQEKGRNMTDVKFLSD